MIELGSITGLEPLHVIAGEKISISELGIGRIFRCHVSSGIEQQMCNHRNLGGTVAQRHCSDGSEIAPSTIANEDKRRHHSTQLDRTFRDPACRRLAVLGCCWPWRLWRQSIVD